MQIFISYSRATPYIAEVIQSLLTDKYTVWLDLNDIAGGEQWEQALFVAIEKSFLVIVLVTKQALNSEWIRQEIETGKQQHRTILPLIMERLEDVEDALRQLDIAEFQVIDFVNHRRKDAEIQLLTTVETYYSSWSGIIPFLHKLKSTDKAEQILGIRQIAKANQKAKSLGIYIYPFLKNVDWEIRREATEALVSIGDKTSIKPLIELIREGLANPIYKEYLAFLQGINKTLIKEAYDKYQLGSRISSTIDLAFMILGWVGDLEGASFLRDQARKHNILAITSLGYIRDKNAVKILTNILDNSWRKLPELEFACIWSLGRIGARESANSLNTWIRKYIPLLPSEEIEDELVKGTYEKNAPDLWDDLNIPHYFAERFVFDYRINILSAGILVLGILQNNEVVDTLIEILLLTKGEQESIDFPSIHCSAAFALGLLGDKKALPELKMLEITYKNNASVSNEYDYYPIDFIREAISMIETKNFV